MQLICSIFRFTGIRLSSLTLRDLTAIPKPENTSSNGKELFAEEFQRNILGCIVR